MSILTWQIFAMETPFEGYTMNMFTQKVVKSGHRPKCDPAWPPEVQDLLRQGWGDLRSRPSMEEFMEVLREEINKNSTEEVSDIMDASRKSELSLRRGQT